MSAQVVHMEPFAYSHRFYERMPYYLAQPFIQDWDLHKYIALITFALFTVL